MTRYTIELLRQLELCAQAARLLAEADVPGNTITDEDLVRFKQTYGYTQFTLGCKFKVVVIGENPY